MNVRNIFKLLIVVGLSIFISACSNRPDSNIQDDNTQDDNTQDVTLFIDRFGQGVIKDKSNNEICDNSTCSLSYTKDQNATLTAIPEDGWQLNSWVGCDTVRGDECIMEMTEKKSVFPTFERISALELHTNVLVLDDDTIANIVSIHDEAIIFSSQASSMSDVTIGTILVSTAGEGFAREVSKVISIPGSNITIATKNVPLEEVVGQGTIIANDQLTNANVKSSKVDGIQMVSASNDSPVFTFEVDVTVQEGVNVKGTVEIEIIPDFAIDFSWSGLEEFKSAARFIVKPSVVVSVSEGVDIEENIYLDLPVLSFPLQVGIVTITQEVKGRLKLNAKANVITSMNGWVKVNSRAGIHYIASTGWTGIGSVKTDGSFDPLEIQGKVEAEAMVGPEYGAKIYGIAGPTIFVGPYVNGSAAYKPVENCGSWAITAGARASAAMEGKVLGWKVKSVDLKLFDMGWKLAGDEYGTCGSDEEAPSVSGEPIFTDVLPTSIDMTWDASTDNVLLTQYEVYRDHKKVSEVTSPTYVDTLLKPDTKYCYYIVAVDNSNNKSIESATSCIATTALKDDVEPIEPDNLMATAVSSSAIELKWNLITDESEYVAYLIYDVKKDKIVARSEEQVATITRLNADTEYCFKVASVDKNGKMSELSNQACATTNATGSYRMRIKCQGAATYAVDTKMDLDETIDSVVSVVGSATDYNGGALSYVLFGNYDNVTNLLDSRIDWSFAQSDCARADTFIANLDTNDTGDVTMNQIQVCGCTAQIRFNRENNDSPSVESMVEHGNSTDYFGTLSGM